MLKNMNPDVQSHDIGKPLDGWRLKLYTIIFEADTRAGRLFDLILLLMIVLSVSIVFADSVASLHNRYGDIFLVFEYFFTIAFTIEYGLRLLCVRYPSHYAKSFFGVVDFLSILPTYLALLFPGFHALIDVRVLRLLRVFRILGLSSYVNEYYGLILAIRRSTHKILIFLSFVVMVTIIMGTVMYMVEGEAHGFSNIPVSIYWAITTMTTVGYGDLSPQTGLGRLIASVMMLVGWGTLAVPTGIVAVELGQVRTSETGPTTRSCHVCLTQGHLPDANFCMHCGHSLTEHQTDESSNNSFS
ncbi:MAG: ion transporter [Gammaproteobacteria bacterium]|nr:ion transporter [Gammaproteobacteria bacterium]